MDAEQTSFRHLDSYLALPRISGLALSPAGDRLVVEVAVLNEIRTAYVSSLWQVDPAGERAAQRLTFGEKSERGPVFLADSSLVFVSSRSEPDGAGSAGDDRPGSLWMLPPVAGEARPLASRPGGIEGVVAAREAPVFVVSSPVPPSAASRAEAEQRLKQRKELKINAVLHESYPARYWDHDLGPDHGRLFLGRVPEIETTAAFDRPGMVRTARPVPAGPGAGAEGSGDAGDDPAQASGGTPAGEVELSDLTGDVGPALSGPASWALSPDGATVAVSWLRNEPAGSIRGVLSAIDAATGEVRHLLEDPLFEYGEAVFSPDGARLAVLAERRSTPTEPIDIRLCVLDLESGELQDAVPGWDRWATSATWTPDGSALLVTADDDGRGPVFRIDLTASPQIRTAVRLTGDDGAYSNVQVSPNGSWVYALRSAVDAPPAPVRLDASAASSQPMFLRGPAERPALPGTLTEIETQAGDGVRVRGWLALPAGAGPDRPAPLLLFVHGGPLNSWNAWQWRWNPWLAVAQGYAVLLPDPALSTGYGLDAIRRGWGAWGAAPYTDLMAITDVVVARPDVDADRIAAMGGSFGGYMVNWIAGHTDRFAGLVSHAGIWSLDLFGPTTDGYYYWRREMTPQMAAENSPHLHVADIRTPMLVIHGERDFRVPISEAITLWAQLAEHNPEGEGHLGHRFLLFPDENHWILKPQHTKLWYDTIFAFLSHTLDGKPWAPPELLR